MKEPHVSFHSGAMLAGLSACVEESTPFSKRLILVAYLILLNFIEELYNTVMMKDSCCCTVIRVAVIIIIPYSRDIYGSGGGGGGDSISSKHNDEHSFRYIGFFLIIFNTALQFDITVNI
jgi:hypothetical protein